MTIRLLAAYGIYPCNAIVTLDSPTEAGLIAAKQALADTTGGTPYVAPVLPEAIDETKSGSAGTDSNGNVLTPVLSSHNLVTGGSILVGDETIPVGRKANQRNILIIGDSIAAYNYLATSGTSGPVLVQYAVGFMTWAEVLLKQRFTKRIVKAVGGLRAWQLVTSNMAGHPEVVFDDFVVTPDASECLIYIGVNDIASDEPAATVAANIYTIWEAATKSGKRTAVCPIQPNRTGAGAFTAARMKEALKCNEMLCNWAATVPGFYLIDTASPLVDYTLPTVYESPATTGRVAFDDVHPNNRGAYLMGKAIAAFYDPIIPKLPIGIFTNIDVYTSDSNNRNMLVGGMFPGTLGAGVATGWVGNAHVAGVITPAGVITAGQFTIVAAPDGVGQGQQIDVQVSGAGFVQIYGVHAQTEAYEVGETFYGQADFLLTGYNGSGTPVGVETVTAKVDMTGGALPAYTADCQGYSSGVMHALPSEDIEGRLRTPPYRVSGAETSLNTIFRLTLHFASAGSARVTFWRAAVMENRDYYAGGKLWDRAGDYVGLV